MPDPVPLRTARAWVLTLDREFARTIQDYPGLDLNGLAPLDGLSIAIELEKTMLTAGCFVEQRSRRRQRITTATGKALKRKTAPLVEHVLRPNYAGRFSPLARAYEAQRTDPAISDHDRKSVLDFLLNWLAKAEREMLAARLPMEDAKGRMRSALVQAASIDPLSGEFVDPDGNARAGVTVDRSRLIERFPPERSEARHPEWQATLAEAGTRPRLPDREWLRLQEATTFAYYGVAFSSRIDSLLDLSAIDETLRELGHPSIYGSIDVYDGAALKRAELQFNKRLSEAGLAGSVKFRANGADIPIHCFLNIRDFSILDDTIRPKLSDSYREIAPELRDVMVERDGYVTWFRENYPDLCKPDILGRQEASATSAATVAPGPEDLGRAITEADKSLWPDGPPKGMRAKVRRDKIRAHLKPHIPSISDRTFQRYRIGKT